MPTPRDLERERHEARLKMQRDIPSFVADAREQGREEILAHHVRFCQRLLRRAETPVEQLLALSLEDLRRLAQPLDAELIPPPAAPS
jgi:hypothetical protein